MSSVMRFCSLFSGSSGNCIFIGTEKVRLLVDAGVSGSRITAALSAIGENPNSINGILITHEHSDHIKGVGILSRKYGIPIYASDKTWQAMDNIIGPLKEENKKVIGKGNFEIGDIGIEHFSIPHDAVEPLAYSFVFSGKKISVATDMGHVTEMTKRCISGSDLILLESNHDVEMLKTGTYPWYLKKRILGDEGHLSNDTAAFLVGEMAERGTRRFLLGHLSLENNFPELALQTTKSLLQTKGIKVGTDVYLNVASREKSSEVILI